MTDYTKLVEALRFCFSQSGHGCGWCPYKDHKKPCDAGLLAAAAIEALQAQLPKRGEWVGVNPMVDSVQCSICGGQLFSAELKTPYCPYCGAKMEVQE